MANTTRSTIWTSLQILTAAALNNEFNNLLNSLQLVDADVASNAQIATTKILFGGSSGQYVKSNGDGTISYAGLVVNRAFGFTILSPFVGNGLDWNPTSPQAMTAVKAWIYADTAPTGASLIARVYNVTQARDVVTITLTATNQTTSTTSMTNAAIAAGDVLRFDITQIGSTIAGGKTTVILECTQP